MDALHAVAKVPTELWPVSVSGTHRLALLITAGVAVLIGPRRQVSVESWPVSVSGTRKHALLIRAGAAVLTGPRTHAHQGCCIRCQ